MQRRPSVTRCRMSPWFSPWLLTASLLVSLACQPVPDPPPEWPSEPWLIGPVISATDLQPDIDLLEDALRQLHPGLFRYHDEASLDAALSQLRGEWSQDLPLEEAYLSLSTFLATIRCGHTYANFWNQSEAVQEALFHSVQTLPWTFRWVEDRMVVTESMDNAIEAGMEVLSIDGVPVAEILQRLMLLVKADGSNDGKRRYDLQVTGVGKFEAFDILYPLLFSTRDGQVTVTLQDPLVGEPVERTVSTLTRQDRAEKLVEGPSSDADLWQFEVLGSSLGRLTLGTFTTWNMDLDWKAFLDDVFRQLREENVPNLVIDIRGNEGGDGDVVTALLQHLASQPLSLPAVRELVRYTRVPEHLNPHLDTWDDAFRDVSAHVEPAGDGFYARQGVKPSGQVIDARSDAYDGQVYLLVDAGNSSATFHLASALQASGRATLVGQETGGNRRGINGGQMFFLRLPGSGLETDIPLTGYFPLGEQPDAGLVPDVEVTPAVEDVAQGVDQPMLKVRELIAGAV